MNEKNLNKFITEALAIEEQEAIEAGTLGFIARSLIQATLPHRRINGNEFSRVNGAFTLTVLSPSSIGLPFGNIPRLLLAWITTEATKTKSRELILGDNLSQFMRQLDLIPTGGRWGTITRLREQMIRLFSSTLSFHYDGSKIRNNGKIGNTIMGGGFKILSKYMIFWDPKSPQQDALWQSSLLLTQDFFDEIITNPVPIDLRALKAIKQSPMAIDIYCWLTYRMSYLKKQIKIPWAVLNLQFGANYSRCRDFKKYFKEQLKKVLVVYPEAKVNSDEENLTLNPSKTHIKKITC